MPLLLERDGFAHRHSYLYLGKIQDLWGNRDEAKNYYNHVLSYPEYDEAQDQASTLDKKLEEFSDGQKNKPLYDSWYEHQRNLAKLQGYDYKDPREVKKESLLWSWKWGIAFVIFFVASLIYTVFAGFGEAKNYIKKRIQERKQSGKKIRLAWTAFIIFAAFLLGIASTLYGEYKIGGGILKGIQKVAADFFAVVRKTVKGVGL